MDGSYVGQAAKSSGPRPLNAGPHLAWQRLQQLHVPPMVRINTTAPSSSNQNDNRKAGHSPSSHYLLSCSSPPRIATQPNNLSALQRSNSIHHFNPRTKHSPWRRRQGMELHKLNSKLLLRKPGVTQRSSMSCSRPWRSRGQSQGCLSCRKRHGDGYVLLFEAHSAGDESLQ
jgi:hypothetical protein